MLRDMLPVVGLIVPVLLLVAAVPLIFQEMGRARAVDRRLSRVRSRAVASAPAPVLTRRPGTSAAMQIFVLTLLRALSMVVPVGAAEREKLSRMLRKGGFARADALSVFLCIKLACALASGAAAGTMAAKVESIGQYSFAIALAALVGFIVGGILPEYGLRSAADRRLRRMQTALPDALDLMVMCLESGLTVERGMITVAEEIMPIEPGLAKEFQQIEAEIRLGSDRRTVLEEYCQRTEVEGLGDFAMALIQSDRYGTPLSQSMKSIAADERLQMAARVAAQAERLPVLMTLPMLVFVVPGTTLLVAGPGFLRAMGSLNSLGG